MIGWISIIICSQSLQSTFRGLLMPPCCLATLRFSQWAPLDRKHLHIYTCVWHSAGRTCKRVLWIPPSNYKIWWWYWAGATSINIFSSANPFTFQISIYLHNHMIYSSHPLSSPQKIWLFNSHHQIVLISNESHCTCSALLSTSWLYFCSASLPPKPGLQVCNW